MATEILRPNAPGDETNILHQTPGSGSHYDKVDDATPDEDSTEVHTSLNETSWYRDFYNLTAHSGSGTINFIRVYARARSAPFNGENAGLQIWVKTGGAAHYGTEIILTTLYNTWYHQWNTNPHTGLAWTWNDIDALQLGIALRDSGDVPGYIYSICTQVYVLVDFTFFTSKQSSDSGSGVDAKVSQNVQLVKSESGLGFDMGIDSPQVAITKAETGGGVDASALLYELSLSESGAGLDAVVALVDIGNIISTSDSGVGVEHYRRTILGEVSSLLAEYSLYDAAVALEASILTAIAQALQVHDSGSGIDASVLKVWHDLEDSGTAVEALILTAAILANQTGLGTDKVLDRLIRLVETGTGAEAVLLVGLVGRLMKLLVYTRAYSNLRVYTKPYSDLRVFTKPYSNLRVFTRPYSDLRVFTKKYSDLRVYTAEVKQ
jgi:hypothetical protein